MLMGFLGYNGPPGASATPSEEPPDEKGRPPGDPNLSKSLIDAARQSRLQAEKVRVGRFRFGTNRFSWAVSLLIHGTVIIVAYFAVRSYLRKPVPQSSQPTGSATSQVFLSGSDSASAFIVGQSGLLPAPDSVLAQAGRADREALPEFQWEEHATLAALRSEDLPDTHSFDPALDTSSRFRPPSVSPTSK
jgi:hypothetical protein